MTQIAPRAVATTLVGFPAETRAAKIARLQDEAKALAADHVQDLIAQMDALSETAAAIAHGGEAYPAGIREIAVRLADEIEARSGTVQSILARKGRKDPA